MRTSDHGVELIKQFEGLRLHAYLDSVGVPTIGYGSTSGVELGDTITPEGAERLLREDLREAESAIDHLVTVPLSQNQFDALASFVFNVGHGNLASSTLLRKLNAGDYDGAAEEFPKWRYAGGQVLAGLERRRRAEAELFGSPDDINWYSETTKISQP